MIATCGYEERARFASETLLTRIGKLHAFAYDMDDVFEYRANRDFFESHGSVTEVTETSIERTVVGLLQGVRGDEPRSGPLRVAVDISSMDRDRIGGVARAVYEAAVFVGEVRVDFIYAPGNYASDLIGSEGNVLINRPMTGFGGWSGDPDMPLLCVLGLGFEHQLALAALETLEPSKTIAFTALSTDGRYEERVTRDNSFLIETSAPARATYEVDQPLSLLRTLDAVVHSALSDNRVVVVPLGPKIFALAAVLVALSYDNEIAVWRVSSGENRTQENRTATGNLVGVSARLRPTLESSGSDS
ncbi:hypothetical protein BH11ACT5_BH11ACT5_15700 [soil metagenome]